MTQTLVDHRLFDHLLSENEMLSISWIHLIRQCKWKMCDKCHQFGVIRQCKQKMHNKCNPLGVMLVLCTPSWLLHLEFGNRRFNECICKRTWSNEPNGFCSKRCSSIPLDALHLILSLLHNSLFAWDWQSSNVHRLLTDFRRTSVKQWWWSRNPHHSFSLDDEGSQTFVSQVPILTHCSCSDNCRCVHQRTVTHLAVFRSTDRQMCEHHGHLHIGF